MPNDLCLFDKKKHEPEHAISVLITYTSSEGLGKPAHMRNLSRAFAAGIHNIELDESSQ